MDLIDKNCDFNLPCAVCYIGNISGWISSLIWFIVLFPQLIKNYKRKKVKGISVSWALMNFFASFINLFFVYSLEMPIFSKISAVYMPILEYLFVIQILYYHEMSNINKKKYFILFNIISLLLGIFLYFISKNIKNSLSYIEWSAIILWSIESFPQIYLNFKLENTEALSNLGQLITFLGKTADITGNYLLIIPKQYRFLGFFSTSNAYFGIIQVINYHNFNSKNKYGKHSLSFVVFIFFLGTMFGFIYRIDNLYMSITSICVLFLVIFILYLMAKKTRNRANSQKFIPIE